MHFISRRLHNALLCDTVHHRRENEKGGVVQLKRLPSIEFVPFFTAECCFFERPHLQWPLAYSESATCKPYWTSDKLQ